MKQYLARLVLSIGMVLGFAAPMVVATLPSAAYACDNVTLSSPFSKTGTTVNCNQPGGLIFAYLRMVIAFLSGAVGLVIVLMIVIGGVQYATSVGDPGQVKAAKTRITNAITALVLFVMMYAILNFLIPGGIIG